MKKTLALLLALITMLSFTLASCNKDGETEGSESETTNNDIFFGNQTEKPTEKPTEEVTTPPAEFTAKVDTVYAMWYANVREEPNTSSEKLGSVEYKAALQRTETNGTWSKVSFVNEYGETVEGYIANYLVTTNEALTKFENAEQITMYVTASTLNLRATPWAEDVQNGITSIKHGAAVKRLGTTGDGSWTYVEFTYTDNGESKTVTGYCNTKYLSATQPEEDATDGPTYEG